MGLKLWILKTEWFYLITENEIEKHFDVNWNKSSNKKALLNVDRFGYLSLHYICRLKKEDGYSENEIFDFLMLIVKNETRARRQAKMLLDSYKNIKGEK